MYIYILYIFEQSVQRVLVLCFTKSFGEKQPHNVVPSASLL